MVIALLADIHGNLEALEACLEHAAEAGATRHVFLGDFVGYGADPRAGGRRIARFAADGAVVVKGNHDEAIDKRAGYMNESTQAVDRMDARGALRSERRPFLERCRSSRREGAMCFVHASARSPRAGTTSIRRPPRARSAEAAQATVHVFGPRARSGALLRGCARQAGRSSSRSRAARCRYARHRRWLAIVGSVGQPRDGNPAAAYALFDPARERDHLPSRRLRQPRARRARFATPAFPKRTRIASSAASERRHARFEISPGTIIDGFRLGECIHAGAQARIYRIVGAARRISR